MNPDTHTSTSVPGEPVTMRLAVLSDTHLAPTGTPDGVWNNATRRSVALSLLQAAVSEIVERGHSTVLSCWATSPMTAPPRWSWRRSR